MSTRSPLSFTQAPFTEAPLLLIIVPFFAQHEVLSSLKDQSGEITPVMWAMGALIVVMVVDLAILFLILRDALEEDANWLHGVGAIILWFGLALCLEGFEYLIGTLPSQGGTQGRVDGDIWMLMGFVIIFAATVTTLILLGLNVRGILMKIRQERKNVENARRLRGTLARK